ncbi:hypothetical protein CY35_07G107400 [Sphagnum magellanicum]|uniref:Uncharacterized protein n=1 Tax=Sphagnum magellanicum TaxID=128215 RepID=A0ACB8HNU5_9BRYO|nr:hypothetical protein CY35_07G107400 [Sphagnum magellanicum]
MHAVGSFSGIVVSISRRTILEENIPLSDVGGVHFRQNPRERLQAFLLLIRVIIMGLERLCHLFPLRPPSPFHRAGPSLDSASGR